MTLLEKATIKQLNTAINENKIKTGSPFLKEELHNIPDILKNFFYYTGYYKIQKMKFLKIEYDNAWIKFQKKQEWKKLKCKHYIFAYPPFRLVYLKTFLWRFLILEGIDSYKNGHGSMQIKLGGIFNILNRKNNNMSQSALVTWLAELPLIPSGWFNPNINWHAIRENELKVEIRDNNINVKGVFTFDDEGKIVKFSTNDRYQSGNKKIKWTAYFKHYQFFNGLRLPSMVIAEWNYPDYDFEYFKARFKDLKYY